LEEKSRNCKVLGKTAPSFKIPKTLFVDEKGNFLPAQAFAVAENGLGEMSRPSENRGPREMADFANTLQKWMKENTRLGIPILFHEECSSCMATPHPTELAYPQAIALASTWDPSLVRDVFAATAAEVRARALSNASRRCSIWPVIRAGDAPRRPMVRILIWCRALASRRFKVSRARPRH